MKLNSFYNPVLINLNRIESNPKMTIDNNNKTKTKKEFKLKIYKNKEFL